MGGRTEGPTGMDAEQRARWHEAIESARAAVARALAERFPGAEGVTAHAFFDEVPATWEIDGAGLTWHVVLVGVEAGAVEIDALDDALLVRARSDSAATGWLGAVLPVPRAFDLDSASAAYDGAMSRVRVPFKAERPDDGATIR